VRHYILLICCVVLVATTGSAQDSTQPLTSPTHARQTATATAAAVGPATVLIRAALPGGGLSTGSGFIVDPSGTIVTNFHVVEGADRVEVRLATGDVHEVTAVRAADRLRDLAVLQAPGFRFPTVHLGDSDVVRPGDHVVVIGNALGILENSVTTGVISGLRDLEGYKLFQMDAAISKGNSGGPVVNEQGEVIGVTVAKIAEGESLNFAIPINYARGLLQMEAKTGLESLRGAPESLFSKSNQGLPRRWKSLNSGTTKIIRVEGDFLYTETVFPEQYSAAGGMAVGELRKQGDKWIGKARARVPCTTGDGVWTTIKRKTCSFESTGEITLLTPTRIEGTLFAAPDDAELKCRTCTYSKADIRRPFVWIPE